MQNSRTLAFTSAVVSWAASRGGVSGERRRSRRSNVIGIFPNEESILRLMGSALIEKHEEFQGGRALFRASTLEKLMNPELPEKQGALKLA
ncbi:MAG: transposase [Thermoguttaceae bacterium]|nr:transposase [Thermoguttaceae bacterium]